MAEIERVAAQPSGPLAARLTSMLRALGHPSLIRNAPSPRLPLPGSDCFRALAVPSMQDGSPFRRASKGGAQQKGDPKLGGLVGCGVQDLEIQGLPA